MGPHQFKHWLINERLQIWRFLCWGYPSIIHFNRNFHYKRFILGYPHLWKPPCVCVWNICIDVKLLIGLVKAGGHRRPIELCPTKLSMVSLGYPGWSPGRTCEQSYVLGMARGQAKNRFTDIFYFMHGCRNLSIWSCNFSPFQNAELWVHYFNLGFISPFLFTSWTSRGVRRRGLFII